MKPDDTHRSGLVALVGWTNVGKSTLLNQLVGTKLAAVADVAQTTRHRITGVLNVADRGQLIFVDTPGLHRPRHRMNRNMVELATKTMTGVDVVVLVVDASRGLGAGDREAAERVARSEGRSVLALNKIDLVSPKSRLLPLMQEATTELGFEEVIPISAQNGDGCPELVELLLSLLPVGPAVFPPEYLTDQPERVLVAEFVREQLVRATRQELPHATAVLVEHWVEREDGLVEIEATVLVDRESQKPIVIGRQGERLKQVGIEARRQIEEMLDRRVFLRTRVRVRSDWRNNERVLRELGLA